MKTWEELLDEHVEALRKIRNDMFLGDDNAHGRRAAVLNQFNETQRRLLRKLAAEEEEEEARNGQPVPESQPDDRDARIQRLRRALGSAIAESFQKLGHTLSDSEIDEEVARLEREGL